MSLEQDGAPTSTPPGDALWPDLLNLDDAELDKLASTAAGLWTASTPGPQTGQRGDEGCVAPNAAGMTSEPDPVPVPVRFVAPVVRLCRECGEPLPVGSAPNRKFCPLPSTCGKRSASRAGRVRARAQRLAAVSPGGAVGSARRGPLFEAWVAAGWPLRLASESVSVMEVARACGSSQANVSRWWAAWKQDEYAKRERGAWVPPAEIGSLLAPGLPLRAKDLRAAHPELSTDELEVLAERLLEDAVGSFVEFRARFFHDEWGQPYQTPVVHRRWVALILRAMLFGRRQVILSPPRHGKSQLLIHFAIWLICRFPNIRIMWIGGNESIAKNATGAVLDELENNRALIEAVLGPERTFKPPGRGGVAWSSKSATVATRSGTGIKSATLVAIGKGGKILSRDADLIIPDDIVEDADDDHDSDFRWLNTKLSSRKEEHSAIVAIGSRQAHRDLWGRLVRNQAWSSLVEHAHDPTCELPTHPFRNPDDHGDCQVCAAHVDCMLFPELRSFAWLQDQRASYADDLMWEMVYQNVTRPEGADPVTLEHLQHCRNPLRRIGDIPPGCELIAGHDPASSGVQGNVLWAVDTSTWKRYLVDLEAQKGGGTPAFRNILREWNEKYGVKTWVAESQNNSDAIQQDRDIVDYCATNGIVIHSSFTTRWNKWSPDFGVPVQLALFRRRELGANGEWFPAPLIDIPFGDEASIAKVRPYEQQVMNFEPGARNNGDLLMAGWFPENEIRFWRFERAANVQYENDSFYPGSPSGDTYQTLGDAYALSGT